MSDIDTEFVLTDSRLVLLATQWSSLDAIRSRVKPRHRPSMIARLNALVDLGLLEKREASRKVGDQRRRWVEWRRSNLAWRNLRLTWSAAVIGQLGFVWVDGGPLYVRMVASLQHTQHSHRTAVRRCRIKNGTFRARGPQRNPRKRRNQVAA